MELVVDLDAAVPVFEQVRAQVTELVESGALPPGYTMPSVRGLAADLGVAPGTIARAYRELGSAGVLTASRTSGTTVAEVAVLGHQERRRRLSEAAARLAGCARRLGARDAEVMAALAEALAEMARSG